MPYPIQSQMVRRVQELRNSSEFEHEVKRGFRGNVINLNMNNNRGYLLDALQLPLLSFRSKLQHINSRITMMRFTSHVTHRNYMMQIVHRSGYPNVQRYRAENHLQHLDDDVQNDVRICVPSRSDDNVLYSLTGKLDHSIGRSFNSRETYDLMIMRNALARMFVRHV